MSAKSPDRVAALLDARLAELETDEASSAVERAPVELDQQAIGRLSRMDAMQVQAMAAAQARRRSAQRRRLEEARARLSRGEYGLCIACGEPIAAARLDADPAAATCIRCARGAP